MSCWLFCESIHFLNLFPRRVAVFSYLLPGSCCRWARDELLVPILVTLLVEELLQVQQTCVKCASKVHQTHISYQPVHRSGQDPDRANLCICNLCTCVGIWMWWPKKNLKEFEMYHNLWWHGKFKPQGMRDSCQWLGERGSFLWILQFLPLL